MFYLSPRTFSHCPCSLLTHSPRSLMIYGGLDLPSHHKSLLSRWRANRLQKFTGRDCDSYSLGVVTLTAVLLVRTMQEAVYVEEVVGRGLLKKTRLHPSFYGRKRTLEDRLLMTNDCGGTLTSQQLHLSSVSVVLNELQSECFFFFLQTF